jgi:hypothetical protein
MIKKKRVPRAGDRVKVGRRLITVPGVPSMTDPSPVAPTAKPGDIESEKQADELARAIKAAYQ